MRQPKGFFDFTKSELTCMFCPFCFAFIREKIVFLKPFFAIHATLFRVDIVHTFFPTMLGPSHFKIICIIINIDFDLKDQKMLTSTFGFGFLGDLSQYNIQTSKNDYYCQNSYLFQESQLP